MRVPPPDITTNVLPKYRNVRATNEKRNDEAVDINIASALIETNLDELIPEYTADNYEVLQ